jgi:hypothetical protein
MTHLIISEEKFDLASLLGATFKSLSTYMEEDFDPSQGVYSVKEEGGMPTLYDEKRDVIKDLDKGLMLFVPFTIFENDDGNFICADGQTYNVNGNTEEDEDEEDEIDEREFYLGDFDIMGFLIARIGNNLTIDTAVCYPGACGGPLPSVDFVEECGILSEPSEEFIRSFVLES